MINFVMSKFSVFFVHQSTFAILLNIVDRNDEAEYNRYINPYKPIILYPAQRYNQK